MRKDSEMGKDHKHGQGHGQGMRGFLRRLFRGYARDVKLENERLQQEFDQYRDAQATAQAQERARLLHDVDKLGAALDKVNAAYAVVLADVSEMPSA